MSDYLTTDTELTSIANAIRTKGGTSASLTYPAGFVSAIEAIPSGGGGNPEAQSNDVNFYDYDGTILYSYSASDFLNLTALPANPSHIGLTAQGWNWTLSGAKTFVTTYGMLDIGQLYVTDDGKTKIYISIEDDTPSLLNYYVYYYQSVANGVEVDWGDGSAKVTSGSSGSTSRSHNYSEKGSYIITLECKNGYMNLGSSTSNYSVVGDGTQTSNKAKVNTVKKIEIGSGVTELLKCCANLDGLTRITMPRSIASIASQCFINSGLKCIVTPIDVNMYSSCEGCKNLEAISFAEGITYDSSITYNFYNCYVIKRLALPQGIALSNYSLQNVNCLYRISFPEGLTAINGYYNKTNYYISTIAIPSTVTSIGSDTFRYWNGLRIIHMKPTSPPTLGASNVISTSNLSIIYVPYSADHSILNAYKTANNWSTYASKMQEEPAS